MSYRRCESKRDHKLSQRERKDRVKKRSQNQKLISQIALFQVIVLLDLAKFHFRYCKNFYQVQQINRIGVVAFWFRCSTDSTYDVAHISHKVYQIIHILCNRLWCSTNSAYGVARFLVRYSKILCILQQTIWSSCSTKIGFSLAENKHGIAENF